VKVMQNFRAERGGRQAEKMQAVLAAGRKVGIKEEKERERDVVGGVVQ
jgi:hypothetical protein